MNLKEAIIPKIKSLKTLDLSHNNILDLSVFKEYEEKIMF